MDQSRMQTGLFLLAEAAVATEASTTERQVSRIIATAGGPGIGAYATSGDHRSDHDRNEETISDRSNSPSRFSPTASADRSSGSQSHSTTDVERDDDATTREARAQIKRELAILQEILPGADADFESKLLDEPLVQLQSESQPKVAAVQSAFSPILSNVSFPLPPTQPVKPSRRRHPDLNPPKADKQPAKRKRPEIEAEVDDEIDYSSYQTSYRTSTRVALKRTTFPPPSDPFSPATSSQLQLPTRPQASTMSSPQRKARRVEGTDRDVSQGDVTMEDPFPDGPNVPMDTSATDSDLLRPLPPPSQGDDPSPVDEDLIHPCQAVSALDSKLASPRDSDEVVRPSTPIEASESISGLHLFEADEAGLVPSAALNLAGTPGNPNLLNSAEDAPRRTRPPKRYDDFIANDLSSSAAASSSEPEPESKRRILPSAHLPPRLIKKSGKKKRSNKVDNRPVAGTDDVRPIAGPSTVQAEDLIQENAGKAPGGSVIEPFIQSKRCQSGFPEGLWCTGCIGRRTGDSCRFNGLRSFPGHGSPDAPYGEPTFIDDKREPILVDYPTSWNSEMTQGYSQTLKTVLAEFLLPVLKAEQTRSSLPNLIVRNRELGFRVVCDFCMTGIFSAGWLCKCCGREFCSDCYDHISNLSPTVGTEEGEARRRAIPKSELRPEMRLMYCTKRIREPSTEHAALNLVPVSRFKKEELDLAIQAMEAISAVANAATAVEPSFEPAPIPQARRGPDDPQDPSGVGSHPFYTFAKDDLRESLFSSIWARGEAVVVTGLSDSFEIQWTPEWFTRTYGHQECQIVDCRTEKVTLTNVANFFALFGQEHRKKNHLKLKDWPPTSDFAKAFPELFRDFSQAVPMPNYARRDGVLNIAAHYPTNPGAVVPDIGPKMYNALASSELPGGKGSTRLHMDMADAVNIMLFATPRKEGDREVQGTAVWDIYRAEDSNKIRAFLVNKFGLKDKDTDPIHSQFYYLDAKLREELRDEQGVISWRIYQKPGEAVFIPAGCAHQVCNLSDCIKVAVDFISPENISRCAKLTQEFRTLNFQSKAWKEDVLELTQTLYHAWKSLSRISFTQ